MGGLPYLQPVAAAKGQAHVSEILELEQLCDKMECGQGDLSAVLSVRQNKTLQEAPWPLKSDRIRPEIRWGIRIDSSKPLPETSGCRANKS